MASDAPPLAACPDRTSSPAGYHVALDTMMGRRSRHRPEEVVIDGFLFLDTGEYELATACIPLEVFWKMKALDILGNVRSANRARAAQPEIAPQVESVWLVDADLATPAGVQAADEAVTLVGGTRPTVSTSLLVPKRPRHAAAGAAEQVFRMRVHTVHALERVAIEREGPRLVEAIRVLDMLPAFDPD